MTNRRAVNVSGIVLQVHVCDWSTSLYMYVVCFVAAVLIVVAVVGGFVFVVVLIVIVYVIKRVKSTNNYESLRV